MPEEILVHVETRAELRSWLAEHGADSPGVWLVTWRRPTGRPAPSYDDIVEEALCFGWIDSTARTFDGERSGLRLAPRKKGSGWARTNKIRVERLERAGLMTDAGRAVLERARQDGSWTLLDEVENLVVPDDLAAEFAARPGARDNFDAFPRGVRRGILEWIVHAKRPETRRQRVEETAVRAERNERAHQPTPRQ
ncbi:MAG TPA: YdeI/OmpD-associated family protein [Frankiaceae bacterium]|nr:YdeI/OmpD-associated family protein [Frankiaceae bacterium]